MKTLKTSREFRGIFISLRALCQLEDRSLPFSLLDVVTTDGVRHFSGKLSTGDVDCTWEMRVSQNGFWSVNADFHDGGTLAGDFFFADFLLDRDHSVGAKLEGSILNIFESRHLSLSKSGFDRFVREKWHTFEASGPTVRLHAAPAIGALVATPVLGLAAVPLVVVVVGTAVVFGVVFIANLASGKKLVPRACSNPSDTSTACIEFTFVPPEEDKGPPVVGGPQG